jgi:hypothetical protein
MAAVVGTWELGNTGASVVAKPKTQKINTEYTLLSLDKYDISNRSSGNKLCYVPWMHNMRFENVPQKYFKRHSFMPKSCFFSQLLLARSKKCVKNHTPDFHLQYPSTKKTPLMLNIHRPLLTTSISCEF